MCERFRSRLDRPTQKCAGDLWGRAGYDRQRALMAERVRLAAPTTSHKTSSETTDALARRRGTADLPAGSFADARVFRFACFVLAETGMRGPNHTARSRRCSSTVANS